MCVLFQFITLTDKEKQTMRVSEFPSYVNYMHSRKDFNFTEEFAVSLENQSL